MQMNVRNLGKSLQISNIQIINKKPAVYCKYRRLFAFMLKIAIAKQLNIVSSE
jgi:hypothetical protein